jgi:hypothetical protein
MSYTWPATLPQKVLQRGYEEESPNLIVRTDMDAGPAKIRRRHTAGVRPIKGKQIMTAAQVETLDEFYVDTLKGGAERFYWTSPRTGASVEFRFVEKPKWTKAGGGKYSVDLSLEIMP